jgi:hypothetical protein
MNNLPGRKQTGGADLHEQDVVPDLFLFPCPVVEVAPGSVYWQCQWNVCHDAYDAYALAIKSLRGRRKMERKLVVLLFAVVFGFAGHLSAQSASGIIAPSRMIDWSAAGVQGGIQNRTSVCATLSQDASASEINNAIASCSSGGVVSLQAGTYNLSSGINFAGHSNITLRGAGPDKTFLVFTGGVGCGNLSNAASVCVGGSPIYLSPTNIADWTGGFSQGSRQVTLSNVNHLKVGSIIDFDQLNDSSDPGTIFVCDTQGVCSQEGSGGEYRSNRAQNQVATVTAISGNTVMLAEGIYMPNWRSSQSPQAYWPSTTITRVGVEDLSIDNSGSSAQSAVMFASASNSWEKNVRSLNINRAHVMLWVCAHISVISNYFYGTQSSTTVEYGIEADRGSANLIANNIFQHIVSPVTVGPATGDVYAYNYMIDDYYTKSTNWQMDAFFMHGGGTGMDLIEGNEGNGYMADDIHGTHDMLTVFRNRFTGREGTKTMQTTPVMLYMGSRYFNVIGNVLGLAGYHTNYEDLTPDGTDSNHSIYTLGWAGNEGTSRSSAAPNDTRVATTLMRWGNYDVVTGAVRWNSSEVPNSLSQYANPVPSSHSLPASFFLSSQPGWWATPWGTPPWPAIGPDVTGGPGPGGHSYDIPAKRCYNNTSKDSNGILNFSAKSCYSSSPAPSAPTNLGAVAH